MPTVNPEPAPPPTTRRLPATNVAPNLARAIVVIVFGMFVLIAVLRTFYQGFGPPSRIAISVLYLTPMLWLQLYVFGRPRAQFTRPVLYAALLCQAVLVFFAVRFSPVWLSLPGFLAGSVLLALPVRLAWPAFACIVAAMSVYYARLNNSPLEIAYTGVSTC